MDERIVKLVETEEIIPIEDTHSRTYYFDRGRDVERLGRHVILLLCWEVASASSRGVDGDIDTDYDSTTNFKCMAHKLRT